jgi:hypothetical protein
MKRTLFVVCCALSLAGCAGTVAPSQLESPAKALMVSPKPLETLKAGDDLVQKHADLRRQYASETDKQRRLQRWVKTVLKK